MPSVEMQPGTDGPGAGRFSFGPFELDAANATLRRAGLRVDLAPKPFDLLVLLVRHAGRLVSRDEILDGVWGRRFVSESVVKTVVSDLRAALGDDAREPRWVETVARRGYRFIAGAAAPAVTAPVPAGMVARDAALATLEAAWAAAAGGGRRLAFVAGEPGVGKTTLLAAFADTRHDTVVARGQCVEHQALAEPYLPLLDALNGLCAADAGIVAIVRRTAPTWLLQMPWHLTDTDRQGLRHEVAGATPDRMLREMTALLETLAARAPLLLLLEDLHWADPATVRLLDHLARRRHAVPLLVLGSFRPAELIAREHPLGHLRHELRLHQLCTELHLEGFAHAQIAALADGRLGAPASSPLVDALERHTDGLPLFLASVLDELAGQGLLRRDAAGSWTLPPTQALPLPSSLLGLVDRQLQRLPGRLVQALEAAALVSAEFDHLCLAEVLGVEATGLRGELDDLARRGLWLRAADPLLLADGRVAMRYGFRHALFRHAFAHRVGAAARIELHRRLGRAMAVLYGERAGEIAAELALHAEQGAEPAAAARWLADAAAVAMQRLAPQEALALADRGLGLLAPLPDGPARAAELPLLSHRLGALAATQGYSAPAAAPSVARARQLVELRPVCPETLPLWHAIWWTLNNRGDVTAARGLAERLAGQVRGCEQAAPVACAVAASLEGMGTLFANRFEAGAAALERSLQAQARFDAAAHRLPFVQDLQAEALSNLWLAQVARGRLADAAAVRLRLEHRLAQGVDPLSESMALWYLACGHLLCGDLPALRSAGERALGLMQTRAALPGAGPHRVTHGWAQVRHGRVDEGLAAIDAGIGHYTRQGSVVGMAWLRGLQAEAHLAAGRIDGAREHLGAALGLSAQTAQPFLVAYLRRVDGALRWAAGDGLVSALDAWAAAEREATDAGASMLALLAALDRHDALVAAGQAARAADGLRRALAAVDAEPSVPVIALARRRLAGSPA